MNSQVTISKQMLQNMIDDAEAIMRLVPSNTPEQQKALMALNNSIAAVINAATQSTASPQNFSGGETGVFNVDPTKSNFI